MFNLGASELVIILVIGSVCSLFAVVGLVLLVIAQTRKPKDKS